jgi:sugar phosphate isomerase/epimerase
MTGNGTRRQFCGQAGRMAAGLALASGINLAVPGPSTALGSNAPLATDPAFRISLAQWSLHRMLSDGKLDHIDFARFTREEFGLEAVEYVNSFFMDKADDAAYLADMNQRCADHGVRSLLIMVDGEGDLGAADRTERLESVRNHHRWADAARALGCHSIRVNAQSSGSYEEQQKLAADGLSLLAEYCAALRLNVIVENHGGLSSNGQWLAGTIALTGMENCGTLPDFGNFTVNHDTGEKYDRYDGVTELMPVARAVSAKSYDFDEAGNETTIDFARMMAIVHASGYRGYVGIEYEGGRLDEVAGIKATRDLLNRCFEAFS